MCVCIDDCMCVLMYVAAVCIYVFMYVCMFKRVLNCFGGLEWDAQDTAPKSESY